MGTLAAGALVVSLGVAAQAGGMPARDGFLVDLQDALTDAQVASFADQWKLTLRANSEFSAKDRTFILPELDAEVMRLLRQDARVEAAEPNMVFALSPLETEAAVAAPDTVQDGLPKNFPDDPMFKSQWHMTMIGMDAAWKLSQGKGAIVAVIDTGVSDGKGKLARVPDLEGTLFVPGYDFVNDTAQPDDDHGHGTHVAGTIAQRTHNGFGVSGVAPQASIMPLKVLSKQGWGTAGDIAAAIRWAADHGAHVINMSLGGGGYSDVMARAVKYAHDKGTTVICAAGNTGRGRVEYPAAYPGALAVSALGPDGQRAWYSSYGKETFIAAPGGDTRVDLNKDGIADGVLQNTIAVGDPSRHGFFPFQGTSMATPHVAGVAALLVGRGVTKPDQVAQLLAKSASPRGDKLQFGNGALNAAAAVAAVDASADAQGGGALALLGVLLVAFRRRLSQASIPLGVAGVASAVMVGVGLMPLRWLGVDLGMWGQPLLGWDACAWGGGPSLLLASALLPWALSALLLGAKRARGVLVGVTLGTVAFLAQGALAGMDVSGIPGVGGMLDGAWLLTQAALGLWLAVLLARR